MATFYDKQFEPWAMRDGQIVVADKSEWKRLLFPLSRPQCKCNFDNPLDYCDKCAGIIHRRHRPIVNVATDVFEDVGLAPVSNKETPVGISDLVGGYGRGINHRDLLKRLFKTIGETPHIHYLLPTLHPDRARKLWANETEQLPYQLIGSAETFFAEGRRTLKPVDNVILATYVETQADIDRRVLDLAKCRDLCRGLAVIANPKEPLNLERFLYGICFDHDADFGGSGVCRGHYGDSWLASIDWLIVQGDQHPIHPDWIRRLKDQCEQAESAFYFAGWGDYQHGVDDLHPYNPCHVFPPDGPWMECVGKDKSGRLLDSVEHTERIL